MPSLSKPKKKRRTRAQLLRGRELSEEPRPRRPYRSTQRPTSSDQASQADSAQEQHNPAADQAQSGSGQPEDNEIQPPPAQPLPLPSRASRTKSSHQSYAVRIRNQEENYKSLRGHCLDVQHSQTFIEKQHSSKSIAAEQLRIRKQAAAAEARCPACGLPSACCGGPQTGVVVWLIASEAFVPLEIPVYRCSRCPNKPLFSVDALHVNAFPGTAKLAQDLSSVQQRFRVWFDLELLELLMLMRSKNPRIAIESFTASLYAKNGLAKPGLPAESTVRKQLTKSIEEYEIIRFQLKRKILGICEDDSPVGCCPCCSAEKGTLVRVQLYGDGNFRLVRLACAGTATLHDSPLQHKFLPDEDVQTFCSTPAANLAPEDANDCNDFDADKKLGRTKQKYAITGVFAAFCRHGFFICGLNMVTGERWSYATYVLNYLLQHRVVPSAFWYDINCRYKKHFSRWLAQSDLPQDVKDAASDIQWPLPPWHHGMHNAQCQAANSYRGMTGVGKGAGEPPEAAWSKLGPFGILTQYHSQPSRQAMLECIIADWNAGKQDRLPQLLVKMHKVAVGNCQAAETAAGELIAHAHRLGIEEQQLMDALAQQQEQGVAQDQHYEAGDMPWNARYAALMLDLDNLANTEGRRVDPQVLAGSTAASSRMHAHNRRLKIEALIRQIEEEHSVRWSLGGSPFEEGLQLLCAHQLHKTQKRVAKEVQEYLLIENLLQGLGGRRREDKRLLKVKESQRKRVLAQLEAWKGWTAVQQGARNASEQAVKASAEELAAVLRAEYPWTNLASEPNAGLLEVVTSRLGVELDIVSRCQEEIELVKEETSKAMATIARQLQRLNSHKEEEACKIADIEAQMEALAESTTAEIASSHYQEALAKQVALDETKGHIHTLGIEEGRLLTLKERLGHAFQSISSTTAAESSATATNVAGTQAYLSDITETFTHGDMDVEPVELLTEDLREIQLVASDSGSGSGGGVDPLTLHLEACTADESTAMERWMRVNAPEYSA